MNNTLDNVCDAQGMVFEEVAERGYNFFYFLDQYMLSEFVKIHIDQSSGKYRHDGLLDVLFSDEDNNIELTYKQGLSLSSDIAYSIGYVYRGICEITGLSSKEIYFKISPNKIIAELNREDYDDIINVLISTNINKS